MRGVVNLIMLRKLETVAKRPIRDMFDLIVGCSAGGVIALGMGMLDHSIDDGLRLFTELGSDAFVLAGESAASATTMRSQARCLIKPSSAMPCALPY